MDKPKYSILIPVYNVEKYVEECLDSVLNQTYPDFEIIIIDDGSTDSSGEICDKYAQKDVRIKVYHQENQGLMMSRKNAVLYASGLYCLFLDADDYYDITLLQEVNHYIDEYSMDLLLFNKKFVYKNKEYEMPLIAEEFAIVKKEALLKEFIGTYKYNSVVNKVIKRELILDCLDKIYKPINHTEDMLQSVNFILLSESIGILNKSLYYYRMRKSSLVHKMELKDVREIIEVENDVKGLVVKNLNLTEEDIKAFYNNSTNNFMDCVYRLNNSKGISWKRHIQQQNELYNNENVECLLKNYEMSGLTFYNRLRAALFQKKCFAILLFMDRIIIFVQKIIELLQHKNKYD